MKMGEPKCMIWNKIEFSQKIEFIESSKSNWFGRYSWGAEKQVEPGMFENGRKILTNVWQAMLSNTRVLSPSAVSEFRFGVNHFFNSTGRELAFKKNVIAEADLGDFAYPG